MISFEWPPLPIGLSDLKDDIEFMQIECDTYTVNGKWKFCRQITFSLENAPNEKALIRLFGVTELGNSVAAHVHNFTAYFYAQVIEDRVFDP